MEELTNPRSVLDIISQFEDVSLRKPLIRRTTNIGTPEEVDGDSQKYHDLTDDGPVGGASCQWRGLQSFRRRGTTKRLIHAMTLPPQEEMREEEEEEEEVEQQQQQQQQQQQEQEEKKKETNEEKLYKIANELLETEKAYVKRLRLLDQEYFAELLKEAHITGSFPEDVVRHIFSNISSIHQFHSGFLLPELQRRMDEWGQNPRIGDVLQKVGPFLKMYGEYTKAFDRAMELINIWMEKCPRFEELVLDIQKREVSGNLTLQHHMLEPVQRIPRYEMLLKDYLKKIPEDAPDRVDAQKSLEIIFEAAKHSNAAIADMERLEKLWEVYSLLGMGEEMVDPSNRLLREGPVHKISCRSKIHKESHLFLFSNMLLYCVPKFSLTGARFIVKAQVDMDEMQVKEMNDFENPHSFLVSGKSCTLEFQARSQSDMDLWIKACEEAINQNEKKSESFKTATNSSSQELQAVDQVVDRQELGKRAPLWIRDSLVSMCMRCSDKFNALIRRRHHCRACGQVVCWKCSDFKAPLPYDDDRVNRVCKDCYAVLVGQTDCSEPVEKRRGILEKEAGEVSERSLMCSFLTMMDKQGKTRGWFVIPRDEPLVMYMYTAPQDVKAKITIPLLGYQVKVQLPGESKCTFRLSQSKLAFTFQAESEELRDRWVEMINQVANGEIPDWEDD